MNAGTGLGAVSLFALALLAAPVQAQVTELPLDVQQKLDMLGATRGQSVGPNIRAIAEVFQPLLEAAPKDGIAPIRDVAYGPHPRHRLDIYRPVAKGQPDAQRAPVPVVIFVHGGSYVSGDKNAFPAMYSNVGIWFARQGVLALNATYRLAPQFAWPSGAQDVGAMVAWARANAARHGGDPAKI